MSLKGSLFSISQLIFQILQASKIFLCHKLEIVGCMRLFNINDEVYPKLVRLFFIKFKKVESQGRGRFYYITKVKDHVFTSLLPHLGWLLISIVTPSNFPPSMSAIKAQKLCHENMLIPPKLRKSNSATPLSAMFLGSSATS